MSLSTGTRNLKFMQRAAARNALNSPAAASPSSSSAPAAGTASAPGTPVASTSASRGSNAFGVLTDVHGDGSNAPSGSTSRATPALVDQEGMPLSKEEKDALWVMPPRPRLTTARSHLLSGAGAQTQAQAGPSSGRKFVFERSYMPFLEASSSDDVDDDGGSRDFKQEGDDDDMASDARPATDGAARTSGGGGSTSTSAGGGRMAFGNFGRQEKDAETPAGDAYGSGDEDDAGGRHRRTGGRAGYMQQSQKSQLHQGARGKKRTSDTPSSANGYEKDREEIRQAKIRRMAEDRHRSRPQQAPTPSGSSGGFIRPGNYDPTLPSRQSQQPSSSGAGAGPRGGASDIKPKLSTADKLRSIASSRGSSGRETNAITNANANAVSGSNGMAEAKESSKRVKAEPATTTHSAASSSAAVTAAPPGNAGTGGSFSIDERERLLKAQRKKDKKARRKGRDSGPGDGQ